MNGKINNDNGTKVMAMKIRFASINDVKILESERKLTWNEEIRPHEFSSLSEMRL